MFSDVGLTPSIITVLYQHAISVWFSHCCYCFLKSRVKTRCSRSPHSRVTLNTWQNKKKRYLPYYVAPTNSYHRKATPQQVFWKQNIRLLFILTIKKFLKSKKKKCSKSPHFMVSKSILGEPMKSFLMDMTSTSYATLTLRNSWGTGGAMNCDPYNRLR